MHLRTILLPFALHLLPISSLAINTPALNLISLPTHNLALPPLPNHAVTECLKITDPPMLGLNPSNCETAIPIICQRLISRDPERLVRDTWIWTELPGCSLGYSLPERVPVPLLEECVQIFEDIVELCARDSRFNVGGFNVAEMPDFSGQGHAYVEGELMYAMAPERLTLYHIEGV